MILGHVALQPRLAFPCALGIVEADGVMLSAGSMRMISLSLKPA